MAGLDAVRALLRPLARRVALLVGHGVVRASDDTGRVQRIQASYPHDPAGSARTDEHFGAFGWTSRPPVGSEVIALFFNGARDHGVIIASENRDLRPTDLEEGEACAYNAHGVRIYLRADGSIEIAAPGGLRVTAPELTLSGTLRVDGDLEVAGDVSDGAGSMAEIRETYNDHTHAGVETGTGTSAPPLPPMT